MINTIIKSISNPIYLKIDKSQLFKSKRFIKNVDLIEYIYQAYRGSRKSQGSELGGFTLCMPSIFRFLQPVMPLELETAFGTAQNKSGSAGSTRTGTYNGATFGGLIPSYGVDLQQQSFSWIGGTDEVAGGSVEESRKSGKPGSSGGSSLVASTKMLRANLRNLTYTAQYLLLEDFSRKKNFKKWSSG